MKIFGDPIGIDELEYGQLAEVCYVNSITGETQFAFGRRTKRYDHYISLTSRSNTVDMAIATRTLGSLIYSIRPINIDYNQTYIFIINGLMDVTGKLSPPHLDGLTHIIVSNDKPRVSIHISQITDVFPVNEFSNIIYPLAATGNNNAVFDTFAAISDPENKDFFSGGKKPKSVKKQRRRKN